MDISNVFIRFPGGRAKALTLSYDDGVQEDIRLVEIMQKHGLRGTFNLNTGKYITEEEAAQSTKQYGIRLTKEQATELYSKDGVEPALHGLTHPFMAQLARPQLNYEVLKDRENLEDQFGKVVRGLAYPYGSYSDAAVEVLRDCGVIYARTTRSTERFDIPTDWLRMPATCHHKNPRLPELTEQFIERDPKHNENAWLFYLWGHTFEFPRDNNWDVIETFAEKVGGRDDVWYATNGELYEYVESFRALVFSLDCKHVENPTAQSVWFTFRGQLYEVGAGKTLTLA